MSTTTTTETNSTRRINSLVQILTTQYGLLLAKSDSSLASSLVQGLAVGLGEATATISTLLANHRGQAYVGTQNASGDNQLDLDIDCDKAVFKALKESQVFSVAISEETPVETHLDTTAAMNKKTSFVITFDPLDGSSIIDANFTVGSIFGLWPYKKEEGVEPKSVILGRTGREQCASAMALYGPRTTLCIALPSSSTTLNHNVVFEVTLVEDTSTGGTIWVVTKPNLKISPSIGKIFAPGNLRAIQDHPSYASMVQYWMTVGYTLRYSGGMVPDVYHIFIKGKGVFSNISSKKHKAKIRVIYEAAPIALLVECAGGMSLADEDWTSVLDIVVTDLDQRIGLCLGGTEEVELFCKFMTERTTVAHMAAAEGHVDILTDVLQRSESLACKKDENGWEPIHEAVRGGNVEIVQLLMDHGADIHERTMHGEGESSLRISIDEHGYDHPMTEFLVSQGAVDVGPEE